MARYTYLGLGVCRWCQQEVLLFSPPDGEDFQVNRSGTTLSEIPIGKRFTWAEAKTFVLPARHLTTCTRGLHLASTTGKGKAAK